MGTRHEGRTIQFPACYPSLPLHSILWSDDPFWKSCSKADTGCPSRPPLSIYRVCCAPPPKHAKVCRMCCAVQCCAPWGQFTSRPNLSGLCQCNGPLSYGGALCYSWS